MCRSLFSLLFAMAASAVSYGQSPYASILPVQPNQLPITQDPYLGTTPAKPDASKAGEPPASDPKQQQPPSALETKPILKPLDLKPTFQMRGRIETEAVISSQSRESMAAIGDLQNGYGFRRVRLGAQGNIGDVASWVSEVELAGGNVRIRDVFVGLDAIPGVQQLRIGNFREPYSLEGMTSSNFITLLERSSTNVLSPVRNWGVCGFWWPEEQRVLYSLGVFRDGTGNNGQSVGDGDNWAYTTRLTALPVYEPDGDIFRLVHIGGAFSFRVPPGGVINFTPRTTSNLLTVEDNPGSPFLPTVDILANNYQLYNLQAATVRGPLSFQGEWSAAQVQQTNAGSIFVNGVYGQVSYFLTGEHRGYNLTRGSFDQVDVLRPWIRDRTDPRGGYGAFELTARLSYLNFDSPNLPTDVNGNSARTRLYELSLGTNWYLNSYTRIMSSYTAGFPDKPHTNTTVAHIFGLRAAVYW